MLKLKDLSQKYEHMNKNIVKPESEVPKSKVPKSGPKGLGLTLKSHKLPPPPPTPKLLSMKVKKC